MILTALACFFAFLFIYDVFKSEKKLSKYDSFDWGYLCVVAGLAVLCGSPAYKIWQLEKDLSAYAAGFADRPNATVSCTSVFDSIFDPYDMTRAGSAFIETGKIVFHHGWCQRFMDYMDDPRNTTDDEIFAMHVFTHEVMHIRGEYNEARTDCQAIQRNHTLARAMGVSEYLARRNALHYYNVLYKSHPYFNKECAPGKKMDEKLPDSIWDDL